MSSIHDNIAKGTAPSGAPSIILNTEVDDANGGAHRVDGGGRAREGVV